MDIFKEIFDWLGDKLQDILNLFINILPDSPFMFVSANSDMYKWFAWANYFIPFSSFVAIGEAWLTCVTIYYSVMVILRWVKALGD